TYIYDPGSNSWTTGPSTNAAHGYTAGTAIGARLFVVAGASIADNLILNKVETALVQPNLTVSAGADQTLTATLIGQVTATLSATVSGGTAPYTYKWELASAQGDGDDVTNLGTTASINVALPLGFYTFKVTVTDAIGATASATTHATVNMPTIGGRRETR